MECQRILQLLTLDMKITSRVYLSAFQFNPLTARPTAFVQLHSRVSALIVHEINLFMNLDFAFHLGLARLMLPEHVSTQCSSVMERKTKLFRFRLINFDSFRQRTKSL